MASNLWKQLTHYIAQECILKYWYKQGKMVFHDTFDKEVFTHAARNVSLYQQLWISKWSCGVRNRQPLSHMEYLDDTVKEIIDDQDEVG